MTDALSFQTRARTIDHLGREQIADVPTAISELWKNAYDAYARSVALEVIQTSAGDAALIIDDGHGMTRDQFVNRWLVVGTASKVGAESSPPELRQGLAARPKQGQKGIGRLSVAALGSSVLLVTKQLTGTFTAALIDWRLFENPFVFLQDVRVPVVEFSTPSELQSRIEDMKFVILENLDGSAGPSDRRDRLRNAWQALNVAEMADAGTQATTSQQIYDSVSGQSLPLTCLDSWAVWRGEADSGTALLMTQLNSSLSCWIRGRASSETDEAEAVRASLVRTLTGFSDPYVESGGESMSYRVGVTDAKGTRTILQRDEGYGLPFLQTLDHALIGDFDEHGVFRGRVRAFGKDIGDVELIPTAPPPTSIRDRVGPFSVCIGAFEVEQKSSILPPAIHESVVTRAETHSGLSVYRDGLRVMPYGRPENDFFKIEERRGYHAGREFWASRRIFGRLAITRSSNPNLRDKAGREGLIDNSASRSVQILVTDLLKSTARRYFGTDSQVRDELLPAVQAENKAAASKAKAANRSQLTTFRKKVRDGETALEKFAASARDIQDELLRCVNLQDRDGLWALSNAIEAADRQRSELKLPPKPKTLGAFEDRYRDYRDRYAVAAAAVAEAKRTWNEAVQRFDAKPPIDVVKSRLGSNQKALTDRLARWKREILDVLRSEQNRIENRVSEDSGQFYKTVSPLLTDIEHQRIELTPVLDEMDGVRDRLGEAHRDYYEPYFRALSQLAADIDLDGAFAYAGAHSESLERKLEQVQNLAQVGISVEILGHELQALDDRMSSAMRAFPKSVIDTQAYRNLDIARREMVERLRFLSQMQVSGRDIRRAIRGGEIFEYLERFFGDFGARGIEFSAEKEFLTSGVTEYPSRILPVFINLINNSIHWLANAPSRKILISRLGETIVVSDSGPGIDADDVGQLFEIFFTRRLRGRGVGLYLCQQTLAAGGHKIKYITEPSEKILPGANFQITLRNGFDA
ncbi:ATP-binding protein [Luteibacter sp.]|uniref:ATP-binding protein n=1 Tax=Luteibacter sp. TaxID=1886636 RepID=UPI00280988E9|nr:ATP-binding protein [Luteibacter sp.]MDQ8049496.1 ATP-binding protein [Luteibacter sp.]